MVLDEVMSRKTKRRNERDWAEHWTTNAPYINSRIRSFLSVACAERGMLYLVEWASVLGLSNSTEYGRQCSNGLAD